MATGTYELRATVQEIDEARQALQLVRQHLSAIDDRITTLETSHAAGATGTFTDHSSNTVTVTGGVITALT